MGQAGTGLSARRARGCAHSQAGRHGGLVTPGSASGRCRLRPRIWATLRAARRRFRVEPFPTARHALVPRSASEGEEAPVIRGELLRASDAVSGRRFACFVRCPTAEAVRAWFQGPGSDGIPIRRARRLCPGTRRSSGRPPRTAVRQKSCSQWVRVSGMPPGRDCDVGQMAMGARFPAIRRFGRAGLEYFYKEEAHRAKPPRRNDPGQGGQSASHFSLGGHRLSSLYRSARVAH